jgi:DNA repair protein RadD
VRARQGNRIIFTVPALSLIDQTVAAFGAEGIHSVGVMQGYHPGTDAEQPVQVCSVQTLARRQKPEAAIVIVDEAHLMFDSVHEWMSDAEWAKVPFIGLSATPWAKGLAKYYDDLIIAATTADRIRDGFLSPFVVYAPSAPDLSGVKTLAGDYHEGQLAEALDQPELVGDVIETWLKRGENRPTLCYGVNCDHSEHLQQRFLEAGVAAEYMDANTKRADRERVFDRFRSGETRVVCNVGVLTVGIDLDVRCLIDARPTKSEMKFVQTIGRGLRTANGKDRLIILDHAGNTLRLGRVTDIFHDHLDDGKPRRGKDDEDEEKGPPLVMLCDECKAVIPIQSRVCPECGMARRAMSEVVHRDGELIEFGSGKDGTSVVPSFGEMVRFYAELRGHAAVKGYRPGWAKHKFREKFKMWPDGYELAPPQPPSLKTWNWIKSRQIAYAKGRRAHG